MAQLAKYADREKNPAPWRELDDQDAQLSQQFGKACSWYSNRLYEDQKNARVICLGAGDRGVRNDREGRQSLRDLRHKTPSRLGLTRLPS